MGLNTKHEQVGGSADARCKQNTKSKNTGSAQAGGRVLIKQNTGHSSSNSATNRKPRTQREREPGRRASCIAHGAGAGATARPESPITHDAESRGNGLYMSLGTCREYDLYTSPRSCVQNTKHEQVGGSADASKTQKHRQVGGCKTAAVPFPGLPHGKKMRPSKRHAGAKKIRAPDVQLGAPAAGI
jgi:hypothetical protein